MFRHHGQVTSMRFVVFYFLSHSGGRMPLWQAPGMHLLVGLQPAAGFAKLCAQLLFGRPLPLVTCLTPGFAVTGTYACIHAT